MGIPVEDRLCLGASFCYCSHLLVTVERVAPWDNYGDGVLTCALV